MTIPLPGPGWTLETRKSDLDELDDAAGRWVTLINPDSAYDNITGEVIAEETWAGGWRVMGMSKHALEFQGWTLADEPEWVRE